MRMVQMVVTNEVIPKIVSVVNAENQPLSTEQKDHLEICFQFLEEQLGAGDYFGDDRLNLADIVAGSTVLLFSRLGISLQPYKSLLRWKARVMERPAGSRPTLAIMAYSSGSGGYSFRSSGVSAV